MVPFLMAVTPGGLARALALKPFAYGARVPKRFKWGRVYSTGMLGSKSNLNLGVLEGGQDS